MLGVKVYVLGDADNKKKSQLRSPGVTLIDAMYGRSAKAMRKRNNTSNLQGRRKQNARDATNLLCQ